MGDLDFAEEIATIFADLLEGQEPLGDEFAAALAENREELYED